MGAKIYTKAERERMERDSHAKQRHAAPPEEQHTLVKLTDATRMLAEVRDAPGAKRLMDLAAAAELYAKKAKLGEDAIGYAMGIKLDAQRKLGEYLIQLEGIQGDRGTSPDRAEKSKLAIYDDIGVSSQKASESKRLVGVPDETFAQVKSGDLKLTQALRDAKRATLSTRIAALPSGTFRVIYADPPWQYGDERGGLEKEGTAAAAQYPTMKLSAICELEVCRLAQPDAVLFLWATFPLLEDGLAVVKAWGFHYKTAFVWDKQRSNIGNYHDARAEILLIGTRGSCPIEIDTRPKQVQSIARGKHSAKPDEFRDLIDQMYPTGPRVELFRRGDAPAGWVVWGNETIPTEAA